MADLPTGTVTFVFTDVEGSTRLLQRVGDRYADLLEEQRRLVRAALRTRGGREFGAEGDAIFTAFGSAVDAVSAAADAQRALTSHRWPDDAELRVRIGVHTGRPRLVEDDYVGLDVHRVARLTAAAHGGQVLVSAATRRDLTDDCDLLDLGEHRLKDLLEPERLYQLVVDGLPPEFPPPRTLGYRPTNLPVQPNALIGRDGELEELRRLVRDGSARLTTLTGPGGIGKTRLAVQLAADVLEDFAGGVFFVSLATVHDWSLVPLAVAQALGVREVPGENVATTVSAYLADRELLLVLDNFEQVVEAAALVSSWLAAAAGLEVVVTSRERLRLAGERVFDVPPLATAADGSRDLAEIARGGAVALFLARAQALEPAFDLTQENARPIEAICARVDGLPLAIELAAGRIPLLSPQELYRRLDRRLTLLTGGTRDLDERQRTLRNTIEWSFELLSAKEQQLFARLGVFSGGFDLGAAEEVCDADVDTLASLLDKSLVRRVEQRFSMLETVREYALERLDEGGEAKRFRAAHAASFLDLAQSAENRFRGDEQVEWLERLAAERDNFAAALEWALAEPADEDRSRSGLALAVSLGRFWYLRSQLREGTARLERALTADRGSDPDLRSRALHHLGVLADEAGDGERAAALFEESLAIHRAAGDRGRIASSLNSLGIVARNRGDLARARELLEETLRIRRELDDPFGVATTMSSLGVVALDEGDVERARALFRKSLALDERHGDRAGIAVNLSNLGAAALEEDDSEAAAPLLREALGLFRALGDADGVAECLEAIAWLAASGSRRERAARLAGAAAALRDQIGSPLKGLDRTRVESRLAVLRAALGDGAFSTAFAGGAALTADTAAAEAFREVEGQEG